MNPIIELAKLSQKQLGGSIITKVESVEGQSHIPVVTASIKLPTGKVFKGTGGNKKEAKRQAATNALDDFYNI